MTLGLFGLLVSRKLRSRQIQVHTADAFLPEDEAWEDQAVSGTPSEPRGIQKMETRSNLLRAGGSGAANGSSRQSVARTQVAGPTSLYGAYRIDQEVGKLILGQPHRMDVLGSRASAAGSPIQRSPPISKLRFLLRDRALIATTSMLRPQRAISLSRPRSSCCNTALPTVPSPARPTFSGCAMTRRPDLE